MDKANREIEDDVLGRWLSGDVTEEERTLVEKNEAFLTYKAIGDYANELEDPYYDTATAFLKLKQRLEAKKSGGIINISRSRFIGVAAGVALILGMSIIFLYLRSDNLITHVTAQGETKSIQLPDNSEVALNISSTLEYDKENWSDERTVKLEGEAYFKVSKGSPFLIQTNQGTVEVLGTEFNVRNRNSITEVICYEGKVKVTDLHGKFKILEIGDVAKIENGELQVGWDPPVSEDAEWKNGFSSFHEVPFENVIKELENQYKIEVNCKRDISNRVYVGAFPHDDLEQALRLIFEPMQLKFTVKNDHLIEVE